MRILLASVRRGGHDGGGRLPNVARVPGPPSGPGPVVGLVTTVLVAIARYVRREFELWRWRRAYARRLRGPHEPVLEPPVGFTRRRGSGSGVRPVDGSAALLPQAKGLAPRLPAGVLPADAPRG
jgi:hypothetical protein